MINFEKKKLRVYVNVNLMMHNSIRLPFLNLSNYLSFYIMIFIKFTKTCVSKQYDLLQK